MVTFVDEYAERCQDLFPEVRSFEQVKYLLIGMLSELKREVGRLVVETTAAVTGKILTPADQRRLVEETAKQVAA